MSLRVIQSSDPEYQRGYQDGWADAIAGRRRSGMLDTPLATLTTVAIVLEQVLANEPDGLERAALLRACYPPVTAADVDAALAMLLAAGRVERRIAPPDGLTARERGHSRERWIAAKE